MYVGGKSETIFASFEAVTGQVTAQDFLLMMHKIDETVIDLLNVLNVNSEKGEFLWTKSS